MLKLSEDEIKSRRPCFPKRVLITGGMPNGNKPLHIGHIGAVFIWADVYARYMRDNIGVDNVLFISGTDGFGSSTEEKYRKQFEAGEVDVTLPKYIEGFHNIQKKTLQDYDISLNLFSASCFGRSFELHKETSDYFFKTLLDNKSIIKRQTEQFYDEKYNCILNGRQVEGVCPIIGCKSTVAYADECALGHQYSPMDLINPISTLSGQTPKMKLVTNYYFNLDKYRFYLKEFVANLEQEGIVRKFMTKDMKDFLMPPTVFILNEFSDRILEIQNLLPSFKRIEHEKNQNFELLFNTVEERDIACNVLKNNDIKYKTNKTLAPLRISGNTKWGVPLPILENEPETADLTFYVWPESLWAPISFTKTYLESIKSTLNWKDWWCDKTCKVVQFIGEDNIYFYALAEMGMFLSMQNENPQLNVPDGKLQLPTIIANKHLLFSNLKASSSGTNKAPTAEELLNYYTPEQLRCHFLSQNLNTMSANFRSKVFDPEGFEGAGDPVVAQGNMLTNIFNRLVRSMLYSLQQYFDGKLPHGEVSSALFEQTNMLVQKYEEKMNLFKFNEVMVLLDEYFRTANQNWVIKAKSEDLDVKKQIIIDTLHVIKTGATLLHPIAPKGAELVAKYLRADERIWNYDNLFKTFEQVFPNIDSFEFLVPKFDFFKKHESQLGN